MFLSILPLAVTLAAPLSEAEEIQVTATRLSLSADQLASPVITLTAADIERGNYQTVADILKSQPGFSVSKTASVGGQIQIRLRGAEANHILVILDGVELNDPAAGDEVQWEFLNVLAIDKIEIIRSPLSADWGSDAMAGVIVITSKDGADARTSLQASYGSFNTKSLSAQTSIKGEKWSLYTGAAYGKSDGVNASRSGGEKDGSDWLTLSGKLTVTPRAGTKIILSARREDSKNAFDPIDFTTGLPVDGDGETETQKSYFSLLLSQQLQPNWHLSARASFLQTDLGTSGAEKWGFYLDQTFTLAKNHKVMMAADYEDTRFTQTGTASPWGDPNQKQQIGVTGVMAGYTGSLWDGLTLSTSLRHDFNSAFSDFTSWRGGVSAQLSPLVRAFASAARGQKAPTFIERFGYFPDQFLGNAALKPEQSVAFEAGFDITPSDTTQITLTAYRVRVEDEIDGFAYDPDSFLFTARNKSGTSYRKGFDLQVQWQASHAIGLSATYSYLTATEEDSITGTQVKELRRPNHTASLDLTFQPLEALSIATTLAYTGQAVDIFYPPWPQAAERVSLDAYLLARISIGYQLTHTVTLNGTIENAFDAEYEDVFGFNTPGRSASLGLKVSF